MKFLLCYSVVVLLLLSQAATAAEPARGRPALYNYLTDIGSDGERVLQQTYGGRYSIVSASKVSGLTAPKVTLQTYPLYGRVPGGPGKVAVAFIVLPNGHVKDPVVFYSNQPRNDRMVREMVSKWLWQPAKLNGAPVPSIMSHYIGFSNATRTVGYPHPQPKKK
jgi:outer membrane biosynthesis protein TonB